MKGLRTLLLLAIPLALVVAGALLLNFFPGRPGVIPARRDAPGRATAPVPPAPVTAGITTPVLTLDRAKDLIARGSIAAWYELEQFLRLSEIADPVGIAQLLVEALARGGNPALFVDWVLPALADPEARAKAVEELLKVAREATEANTVKVAFSLIGKVGSDQVVEELGRLARLEQRQEFFVPEVYAIASIGGATAAAELSRLLAERAGTDSEPALWNAIGHLSRKR
jgi:hypothetical protein